MVFLTEIKLLEEVQIASKLHVHSALVSVEVKSNYWVYQRCETLSGDKSDGFLCSIC